jgi:hypothetical protein
LHRNIHQRWDLAVLAEYFVFLVTCTWARPRVSWFFPFAAFGKQGVSLGWRVKLFSTIVLVPSGDGASLSSGLFDVIVGVGSVVSRRVLGLSDLGLLS